MSNIARKSKEEVTATVQKELGIHNRLAVPKIVKIVLNMGLAKVAADQKLLEEAVAGLAQISGQKPVVTRAKKAIAGFKLRQGDAVGVMVTLRGNRMYDFLEKLIRVVLPRVRDFHGASTTAFDDHGNYSFGVAELSVFPEIDTAAAGRNLGLEVTVKTTAKTSEHTKKLLEAWGMPFRKYG